ncbi:MAG: hypothetical protein GKR89_03255 [Candidatus Latescibacteria bacterium]|nr:hypothetical protein [Candidatus Latescibacterota bacterium]
MLGKISPIYKVISLVALLTFAFTNCSDDKEGGVAGIIVPSDPVNYELGTPFADSSLGIGNASAMAIGPQGRLFIANFHGSEGKLWGEINILEDLNGDGIADTSIVFAEGLDQPAGLAFRGDDLYVSQLGSVVMLQDTDGDDRADIQTEILHLFYDGWHKSNGIEFGPDGLLYVTVGSAFNTYAGDHEFRATILRMEPDGGNVEVFARGIRNAYDIAFTPDGVLFATDNAMDNVGDDPPDELNHIVAGGHYGLPQLEGEVVPEDQIIKPIFEFLPHASAVGLAFNNGTLFPGLEDALFIALYKTGKIVAVNLTPQGDTFEAELEDFLVFPEVSGPFNYDSTKQGHAPYLHRHPLNILFAPDGHMYISANGTFDSSAETVVHGAIYRLPK